MRRKTVSGIMLSLLLIGMLILIFNIQPVKASGNIYIRADGSVDPDTAPISSVDNITYTFTDNINDSIIVERDNIVVDGNGYTLQGPGNGVGVDMSDRSNITIKNVEMKGWFYCIRLKASSNNTIYGNNMTADNWNGISLESSSHNTIYGNNITAVKDFVIYLYDYSDNNTISGNNITNNNFHGIYLDGYSNYNSISGNNIANNWGGIYLSWYSSYNSISGNNITNSEHYGITLSVRSSNNTIYGNNITAHTFYGIGLDDSSNNIIYHNNFVDNSEQVRSDESTNVWDDGYPSGGNYWSDYNGTDLYSGPYQNETGCDGIGDTPYIINGTNQDNYPLIHPYGSIRNLDTNLTYLTIQSAINAPETLDGHTIFVEAGTYYEHLTINKNNLTLIGENRSTTIIDGNKDGWQFGIHVIDVTANSVIIKGFTVQRGQSGIRLYYSMNHDLSENIIKDNGVGIRLHYSQNNSISANRIAENSHGIYSWYSNNTSITRNNITDNWDNSIFMAHSKNNDIRKNTITDGGRIYLGNSERNNVDRNTITKISTGVDLYLSTENTISGNTITNTTYNGLYVYNSSGNDIFHNNFINNTNQVHVPYPSSNTWDDGYPSGGNYWSDHVCTGNPSDGSEPYIIDANNIDHYPFQDPNGWLLHQLTVTSSPITGILFTINGVPQTTPYTEWLLEDSYTLEMPETHDGYVWSHWLEDGDSNRIKTIYLQGTTWTAVYSPPPKPVGGKATPINIPINKPETPALWIWLTTIILSLVLTLVYVKKRKRYTGIIS